MTTGRINQVTIVKGKKKARITKKKGSAPPCEHRRVPKRSQPYLPVFFFFPHPTDVRTRQNTALFVFSDN